MLVQIIGGINKNYEPIDVKVTIGNIPERDNLLSEGSANYLFTRTSGDWTYYAEGIRSDGSGRNDFETNILSKKNSLVQWYPSEDILTELERGMTKIFLDFPEGDVTSETDKQRAKDAINNFNVCFGSKVLLFDTDDQLSKSWSYLRKNSPRKLEFKKNGSTSNRDLREDIKVYHEFVQLKRARFEGKITGYSNTTGRITKMEFKFTGEIS